MEELICKTCGRKIQRVEANFCDYCGAALHGRMATVEIERKPAVVVETRMEELSFLSWLSMMAMGLLPVFISPVYGGIFSLMVFAYWGFFSKTTTKNIQNWARAMMAVVVVFIAIELIRQTIIYMSMPEMKEFIKEFQNQYLNNLKEATSQTTGGQ